MSQQEQEQEHSPKRSKLVEETEDTEDIEDTEDEEEQVPVLPKIARDVDRIVDNDLNHVWELPSQQEKHKAVVDYCMKQKEKLFLLKRQVADSEGSAPQDDLIDHLQSRWITTFRCPSMEILEEIDIICKQKKKYAGSDEKLRDMIKAFKMFFCVNYPIPSLPNSS